jgi:hypothetical protein
MRTLADDQREKPWPRISVGMGTGRSVMVPSIGYETKQAQGADEVVEFAVVLATTLVLFVTMGFFPRHV